MTLKIVLRHGTDGGFWAEVPSLPNCYAQSETEEGAIHGVRQAVSDLLGADVSSNGEGRILEVEL